VVVLNANLYVNLVVLHQDIQIIPSLFHNKFVLDYANILAYK